MVEHLYMKQRVAGSIPADINIKRKDVLTCQGKSDLNLDTSVNQDIRNSQGEECLSRTTSNFLAGTNCSKGRDKVKGRVD